MIIIDNTIVNFEGLWGRLNETRLELQRDNRRFCVRNVLRQWLPHETDLPLQKDGRRWSYRAYMNEVCRMAELSWYDELPAPCIDPVPSRELLRAIAATHLQCGVRGVCLSALDRAYKKAYPKGRRLDLSKKGEGMRA